MYEKKSIYVKIVRGIPMPCSVNYTHKRPLRGHCAPPLQKPGQSLCAFGLTSWGFMVKQFFSRACVIQMDIPLRFQDCDSFPRNRSVDKFVAILSTSCYTGCRVPA